MSNTQPPPYPGFQPYVAGGQYPQQSFEPKFGPYPQQSGGYPQQPGGYPLQPAGYPLQPAIYPQQPSGYPQQPAVYPQPPVVYPQPTGGYPPQPGYTQQDGYPVTTGYESSPLHEDSEIGKDITTTWSGFTDKAIRAVFIRKVYAILMVQLAFTVGVIALFVFEEHVNRFVRRNTYLYFVSYFIFLGVYIALVCCSNVRRKYPTNIILLSIFTLCMSYMMGVISSYHETRVVLLAVGICAGVCLGVSVFSFHTKFDFTTCGGVLCILVWVLFLFGIITIFTYNSIMTTVYAALGALLFTAFLAYDTQMIMGGKKHEMSAEEHIFAALTIYLDIVYIFMFLLMLFGTKK